MSSGGQSAWMWDPQRRDYYFVTRDLYGNYTYHYQRAQAHSVPQHALNPSIAHTSPYSMSHGSYAAGIISQNALNHSATNTVHSSMLHGTIPNSTAYQGSESASWAMTPAPASNSGQRPRVDSGLSEPPGAALIRGTPETGLFERLDPSYQMRTGAEIYQFFVVGKVFSMLHIQAASADELRPLSDNITLVKYGEKAFSQIRRFIVAEKKRGFVYACPITTYSNQGCLKKGCIPSEHSVVYVRGTSPSFFPGEYELGLTKASICIEPADTSVRMTPQSRVHYAKSYPIEMNVKVKDIGNVASEDLPNFIAYYHEESRTMPEPGIVSSAPCDTTEALAGIQDWKDPGKNSSYGR